MEVFTDWYDFKFRPTKTFNNHFEITHQFHGVDLHRITESYIILPITNIAVQLFHEGIQFPDIDIHLKCKIKLSLEQIDVDLHVFDPSISSSIINEIKNQLLGQLSIFKKRMLSDPTIKYVQSFCKNCINENSKPLNRCVQTCQFEAKPKN